MAIAARWYIKAPDTLSGVMLFSCGISGMIFPVLMGLFVPIIGFNWVMTVPALGCLLILYPSSWRLSISAAHCNCRVRNLQ